MFHVLTITYLQPPDVVDQTRPAHLEFLKDEVDAGRVLLAAGTSGRCRRHRRYRDVGRGARTSSTRDPYTPAGVVRYDRVSFTGAFRAPGL